MKVKKAAYNILPETEDTLKTLSEQIKLARLRRDLSATLVAERAGISRASLWKVESGNPAVAIGIYAAVLHALGNMDKDFLLVAKDDERGRQMQDLGLLTKKRASRRKEEWREKKESYMCMMTFHVMNRFCLGNYTLVLLSKGKHILSNMIKGGLRIIKCQFL